MRTAPADALVLMIFKKVLRLSFAINPYLIVLNSGTGEARLCCYLQ